MKSKAKHRDDWLKAATLVLGLALSSVAQAQQDESVVHAGVFTKHYWSQIQPNYSYLNGCSTGYRAFLFADTGYFLFDNRIHGSWRVDRLGNLVLRTKEGQDLRLYYDRPTTLHPIVPTNQLTNQPPNPPSGTFYFRRTDLFEECSN
jgi:hypothetical protein